MDTQKFELNLPEDINKLLNPAKAELEVSISNLVSAESTERQTAIITLQDLINTIKNNILEELREHTANTDNPHNVNIAQLGLQNVVSHIARADNPHNVTGSQIISHQDFYVVLGDQEWSQMPGGMFYTFISTGIDGTLLSVEVTDRIHFEQFYNVTVSCSSGCLMLTSGTSEFIFGAAINCRVFYYT